MLSRQVIAYYGLMRASESLPAAYGFAAGAAAPKENGLRWESRGSPIYSAGLCSRAASHTPATRRVRLTVSSSSVLAFTPVSRVRRHLGSFEAAEFTHSQVHRNCYDPPAGSPSFRGRLHSSLRRRGRPPSASNMTTWINSQFPRPDFHRRVQRHYGLQDTGFPSRQECTHPFPGYFQSSSSFLPERNPMSVSMTPGVSEEDENRESSRQHARIA